MLVYRKMTEEDKYAVSEWRYPEPYDIYDIPPYEKIKGTGRWLDNPKSSFFSFFDRDCLVGYINLHREESGIFVGIGVCPDKCGLGYGRRIAEHAHEISKKTFGASSLFLEVRTWNTRAVRCYENAGFKISGEPYIKTTPAGEGLFYLMVKKDE